MINQFTKIAEKREKRKDSSEEASEGMSTLDNSANYIATCPDHPGVRRLLLGDAEKKKNKIESDQMAWKCPEDGKIYHTEGPGIAGQPDVAAQFNNLHNNQKDMNDDDGEEAAKKLTKEFTYETRDLK
jgi:hypothetical protein